MTYTQKLMEMIDKAKIKKDISKLFEIKEFIENLLQDIEQLKVCMISRGKEVDYIKKEIRELDELNLKIFRVNGDIHRNTCFRLKNIKNKQKGM